jgi:signal transduction histidine kinase
MDALEMAGLRVPTDVAVVGFDDVDEARFASPALTTVRQPLYEQGLQAANMALAMLRGVHVEGQLTLHTELVQRRSCGCFSQTESLRGHADLAKGDCVRPLVAERRERILSELEHSLRGIARSLAADWHHRLLEAFVYDLESGGTTAFISALEDGLRGAVTKGSDGSVWQDAISVLRRQLLPCIADHRTRLHAEDLCQQARLVVANVVERIQAQQRLEVERWVRVLSETNERVITTFDVVSLGRAVAEHLPRLGIQSCYLALYTRLDGEYPEARLVLAHDARRRIEERWTGTLFDARELLPTGLFPTDRRTTFIVEPLFFKEQELGFMLLEMGPRQGVIYEALRDQISAALKGALLVQEVVEKDRERESLMQVLERRATELEQAYTALQKNQEMLLSTEKMASIGRLTASIAHEMNTPVAAVRAALAELGRRVQEYAASANDPEVTGEDHAEIAREMQEALRLATGAAARAADFVGSIKNQTRDTGKKERIVFDAVASSRETLLLLGHSLRKGNCRIDFRPSQDPMEMLGTPGRFGQVMTNLVTNAIDSMVPLGGGTIEIELVKDDEQIVLKVADRGSGIPDELMERIWEPLFTTKPFGHGTGLGLTIVRDIVSADFGGRIDVMSRPEGGVTFTVVMPSPVDGGPA